MIYMLFNADGSRLDYGLAGHYPPIICRRKGVACGNGMPSSLPLGVALPPRYFIREEELAPGDTIAAFSDGLLESRNEAGEVFEDYLPGIMKKISALSADDILAEILKRTRKFRNYKELEDDLTALIVQVKSQGFS